jgi:hypothetical protein
MVAKAAGKLLGIFHRRSGHAGKNSSVLTEIRQKQDNRGLVSKVSICACPGTVCTSQQLLRDDVEAAARGPSPRPYTRTDYGFGHGDQAS